MTRRASSTRTLVDLGGEEDRLAPRRHQLPDPGFTLSVAIAVCRVDVSNSEIERLCQRGKRFVFFLVSKKPASASEGENRDLAVLSCQASASAFQPYSWFPPRGGPGRQCCLRPRLRGIDVGRYSCRYHTANRQPGRRSTVHSRSSVLSMRESGISQIPATAA